MDQITSPAHRINTVTAYLMYCIHSCFTPIHFSWCDQRDLSQIANMITSTFFEKFELARHGTWVVVSCSQHELQIHALFGYRLFLQPHSLYTPGLTLCHALWVPKCNMLFLPWGNCGYWLLFSEFSFLSLLSARLYLVNSYLFFLSQLDCI